MDLKLKLIIGLGNPDKKYANSYHNVGFLFVDYLDKGIKSEVYMNESGKFVAKELKKAGAKPEELLLVHDDSDIGLGKYKLSFGRGAAGHHGVESAQAALKTKNFWRLRIGIRPIGPISPIGIIKPRKKAGEFVLKKISAEDKKILERVFEEVANGLKRD
ncbi:MAG: hypothetical protein A2214_01600 [Candidatus Harrisonbacteria bacterium RIFOXYA1_FULL_48_8]|uniref:Aminoacyl-tRNA hydrolase n=2 Tax=Candidatus Harrisoniibacteriota TaxID=1817905 RepID=A0A1G1ZUB7_9BACT|nr:MAG: hypothetical protein A3E64_01130 [Candidatus Harrisonbacteria bacterium RIFCSPHIGHO2_12_FULL_48_16]OGY68091.1 MAG: hypothetical protein A2214_01600 [Candidatus Harrisonbacteria bacterium RIFOXYA1_FULL_48_8]